MTFVCRDVLAYCICIWEGVFSSGSLDLCISALVRYNSVIQAVLIYMILLYRRLHSTIIVPVLAYGRGRLLLKMHERSRHKNNGKTAKTTGDIFNPWIEFRSCPITLSTVTGCVLK